MRTPPFTNSVEALFAGFTTGFAGWGLFALFAGRPEKAIIYGLVGLVTLRAAHVATRLR